MMIADWLLDCWFSYAFLIFFKLVSKRQIFLNQEILIEVDISRFFYGKSQQLYTNLVENDGFGTKL